MSLFYFCIMRYLVFFFVTFIFSYSSWANCDSIYYLDSNCISVDTAGFSELQTSENALQYTLHVKQKRPNPLLLLFKKKQRTNKKITAAILAFPFPFGIVGLHRIYLGTAPYVPVVYIASLGGVFGILPFIDFCVIALDKNIERYKENKKVFMWVNP